MIGAAILQVPFVSAIGVLVFIGAFVPLVGAFVSGTVAVLVALVAQGPVNALIMFGVIVVVQQIEAHVLQPFLMGRFVSVHPLGRDRRDRDGRHRRGHRRAPWSPYRSPPRSTPSSSTSRPTPTSVRASGREDDDERRPRAPLATRTTAPADEPDVP